MAYRTRIYYTDAQKAEMWDRWQRGETFHSIARLFDRYHTSVRGIIAATGGILLLAGNPHGGEHLQDLLVGQILWTTWSSLLPTLLIYAAILALLIVMRGRFSGMLFYVSFAVIVTMSVQIVGIYLVFASLIVPALATHRLQGRRRLISAYAIGGLSYLLGIVVSSIVDLPTGAVIVWTMALVALIANRALLRTAG